MECKYPVDDDGKLYQRYRNKCVNAKKEGLTCDLTYDEYCKLVYDAGIVSSKLGFTGDNYVLARFNDFGNYTLNNCRFITHKENMQEQRISEKSRKSSMINVEKLIESNSKLTFEERSNRIKQSDKWKKYNDFRKQRAIEHRLEILKNLNPSYVGENNSQYGSFWITNGRDNRKWRKTYGDIPNGWYRGRVVNY